MQTQTNKNKRMENKKLNEKESLELISQMINSTKQNLSIGSGNIFLLYGYISVIISIATFTLIYLTHNTQWNSLWFLMFLPIFYVIKNQKKRKLLSYTDKAIDSIWIVVGCMFALAATTITTYVCIYKAYTLFQIMLPLGLIFISMGTATTGIIIKEIWLILTPIIGFIISIFMLLSLNCATNYWNLLFGLSLFIMMIIPGYILNNKSKRNV